MVEVTGIGRFDVSKEFSDLCLTDSAQNILLKKYKFAHTKKGFNKMLNKVYSIKDKFNKQDIFCGLEPTGKYHKPLASFLLKKDLALCLISTVVSSDNRRSLDGSWRKNDSKDAFNITDLMSRNRFLFYPSPDIFYDGLRDLINHRYKLSKLLRGTKTMIKNSFFSEFFPEIEKIYSNILHPEILHILNEFPTAYHIREISLKKFIRNFYKNKKITNRAIQRLQTVWQIAQDSIGCEPNISISVLAKSIVNQVEFYQRSISSIEQEIERICKGHIDYKLLLTLPGFGPVHAASFMACVKNVNNYKNVRQVAKLAGFDLEYRESGKYKGYMRISKKGKALLRYTLCHAAKISLRNKVFKDIFLEKLKIKGVCRDNK
ncbi:MAG: IS110 family transposase, partial [Candidatus Omnitrophica bacterium]|nr:IS110 family transposase [Candidatus Omnitrophota bacterium]